MLKKCITKSAVPIFLFLTAFLTLMICSKTSFLYPVQNWVDPNCFFTTAKSMANGYVLYEDIFEQKGLLLYVIHIIGYYISNTSFVGVFFIQVVWFTAFLGVSYKILNLFLDKKSSLISIPILSAVLLTSLAYCEGDSAEEFCLLFLSVGLYTLLKYFRGDKYIPVPLPLIFLCGVMAGCVLWIKYTILGFWIGFVLAVIVMCIHFQQKKDIFKNMFMFCLGGIAISAVCLTYFIVNHALDELIEVYFKLNIFGYATNSSDIGIISKIWNVLKQIGTGIGINPIVSFLSIFGIIYLCISKKKYIKNKLFKVCLIFLFVLTLVFMYIGGRAWSYYYFCASVFSVLGFVGMANLINLGILKIKNIRFKENIQKIIKLPVVCPVILVLCVAVSYFASPNSSQIGLDKELTTQYVIGSIIMEKENSTMLNYGCLDGGFYTVTGKLPVTKYFCRLNLSYKSYPEMMNEQNRIIRNKEVDFVVVGTHSVNFPKVEKIPYLLENYKLVKSCTNEENFTGNYDLYEKKE